MKRLPRVVGLILCERLEIDVQTHRASLVGVFQGLAALAFPAHVRFVVYTALYGGKGEGTMRLAITRLETEEEIYSWERRWSPPGRGLTTHVEIRPRRCVFPAAGRYAVSLSVDGEELTSRYLDVSLQRGSR
jgi:hypothetical protein